MSRAHIVPIVLGALALTLVGTIAWWAVSVGRLERPPLEVVAAPQTVVSSQAPLAPAVTPEPQSTPAPSQEWISLISPRTGIPPRALAAYAGAQLHTKTETPDCSVGWNTLAAIGGIESAHGTSGGSVLGDDGWARPVILGPRLDGSTTAAIGDTDGGAIDGDPLWDRAVGPMQFIPSTWATWAADGNGDGRADPDQIDDAALAAARYLCHSGDLSDSANWRRAVYSFNHSDAYVVDIANLANLYTARAS